MASQDQNPPVLPLPVPNADNAGFWEGCRAHELRLQRCRACGTYRHHPRPMCPRCNSFEYEWPRVSGHGTLFSFTIAHGPTLPAFQGQVPYNVVVVQLEEGPYMVSNLIDHTDEDLRIGCAVEVAFEDVNDSVTLPKFRPRR